MTIRAGLGIEDCQSLAYRTRWVSITMLMLALSVGAGVGHAGERFDEVGGPPMENFDGLAGKWDVHSRSLKQRMASRQEWLENHMETEYRILLGGLVAINDTYGMFNGQEMHGIMIRTYDPDQDEWRFQWMSRGYPHLTEQVRGRFSDGIGVFYGQEKYAGRDFKMRFRWKMIAKDHALWEQAYQDPDNGKWVVNWTLELTR